MIDENDRIRELTDAINELSEENRNLTEIIAAQLWDASDIERDWIQEELKELRKENELLKIDNKSLRYSRDMFQNRNAELTASLNSYAKKLKKL
jgi:5'-deoxynucleotidase YfbR-like HD superfamily hydrolase